MLLHSENIFILWEVVVTVSNSKPGLNTYMKKILLKYGQAMKTLYI